jgi:hypothetical protein
MDYLDATIDRHAQELFFLPFAAIVRSTNLGVEKISAGHVHTWTISVWNIPGL